MTTKKVMIECYVCKKFFKRYKSMINKKGKNLCSKKCFGKFMSKIISERQHGKNNPNWKGGHRKRNGYLQILYPTHPRADKKGYVFEHRIVMEKKIGRYLNTNEIVHHINRNKLDNRIINLKLFTAKQHFNHHMLKFHKYMSECAKKYWKIHTKTHHVKSSPV